MATRRSAGGKTVGGSCSFGWGRDTVGPSACNVSITVCTKEAQSCTVVGGESVKMKKLIFVWFHALGRV